MRGFTDATPGPEGGSTGAAGAEDDWALWRRACDGHEPSARRLVQRLTPQAYGLAIQLLGRAEDAQDAVQDAFMRLWRSAPSDTQGAQLSTYFNTIVINRCRTARAARREDATDPDELAALRDGPGGDGIAAHPGAPGPMAGEALAGWAGGGWAGRLRRAVAALSPRQRQAITLWAWADADAPAIGRALDLDANAAHQLLHRARQALRTRLQGTEP
jgi:RNA polymerase sigma-70 factor (ECF subfamily)